MNELALFAGAGGGILGGHLLGWRTVCAVEYNAYARSVLLARQNDGTLAPFPVWDDVRTFDGNPWRGLVDVVSGGFPCTDISIAKSVGRKGLDGEASGLWREMARIIREVRPRRVLVENSPNLVNDGLGRVLGDLAEMGFHARWGVLGAEQFGGDILRKRVWIVASSDIDGLQGFVKWMQKTRARRDIPTPSLDTPRSVRLDRHKLSAPIILRKSDELADRVDRTRAVGNGQVPVVAASAYRILSGE